MSTLTSDQRWLLFHVGGWSMRECLLGPAGTDYFMQSLDSATGFTGPDGGPPWMLGWNTRGGKITSPWRGEVRVVVTKAQIDAYARALPADVRAELLALRAAAAAERDRTSGWCRCPWSLTPPNDFTDQCDRYHPTDAELTAHHAELNRIAAWNSAALRKALALDVGQLHLFADL